MKVEYTKNHSINYTEVNQEGKLDIISAFNLVQNVMTEYFESFKSDNIRLKANNNAIWVVTKAKMHFYKYPMWQDKISGIGRTTKVKPIRTEMETTFRDKNNELLFSTRQESCVIDLDTRKIRKVETVDYPKDMEVEEPIFKVPYQILKDEFSEDDYIYKQKVFSSDIDFSRHTNNVSYVRYIINTLPCKFFEENKITDIEIHYINETREGQILKIYKKVMENSILFLITDGEKEVIRAKIDYKN